MWHKQLKIFSKFHRQTSKHTACYIEFEQDFFYYIGLSIQEFVVYEFISPKVTTAKNSVRNTLAEKEEIVTL